MAIYQQKSDCSSECSFSLVFMNIEHFSCPSKSQGSSANELIEFRYVIGFPVASGQKKGYISEICFNLDCIHIITLVCMWSWIQPMGIFSGGQFGCQPWWGISASKGGLKTMVISDLTQWWWQRAWQLTAIFAYQHSAEAPAGEQMESESAGVSVQNLGLNVQMDFLNCEITRISPLFNDFLRCVLIPQTVCRAEHLLSAYNRHQSVKYWSNDKYHHYLNHMADGEVTLTICKWRCQIRLRAYKGQALADDLASPFIHFSRCKYRRIQTVMKPFMPWWQ